MLPIVVEIEQNSLYDFVELINEICTFKSYDIDSNLSLYRAKQSNVPLTHIRG